MLPQQFPYDMPNSLSSRFTLNDVTVRTHLALLILPATRPEPSANAGDQFNLAFHAFTRLTTHLLSLPSTAKAWTEPLMEEVLESVMAFVLYYIREIVLRGRTVDFRDHEFHTYVMFVLQAVLSHPFAHHEKGYWTESTAYVHKLSMFLVDLAPALILTHDVLGLTRNIPALFEAIKALDKDPVSHEPLYEKFLELLDRDPARIGVLVSAFFEFIQELQSQLTRRQHSQTGSAQDHHDTSGSVFFAYQFICPFLDYGDMYSRLLQGGLTRTGCELLSAVARGAREVVFPLARTTRDKEMALGLGISALEILGNFIILMRLESEGRARIELALHYDVLSQMREFDRLLRALGAKNGNQDALLSEFRIQLKHQDDTIQLVKPYLVFHDLLEMASKKLLRSASPRDSPVWTTFHGEIKSLEADRMVFDKVYLESCEVQDCIHSHSKSPLQLALLRSPTTLLQDVQKLVLANSEDRFNVLRCSGCRMTYYCSAKCQQSDWKKHKSVCAAVKMDRQKTGGPTNVLSRRDIAFMHTIACLTLSRHPPRDGLVRVMDFTTWPPTLTLESVENPAYDYARLFLGEEEIHYWVLQRRALTYMETLGKEEVGLVYSRRFLPKGSQAVVTFVNWEMVDGQGARYKRRG